MNDLKKDLNLSDSFTKVQNELENLRNKHIEENKNTHSDTIESLLLLKKYKKDLKLKFKHNTLLNNPDDIVKYFKDNFKNVNTLRLKLSLLSLGFIGYQYLYLIVSILLSIFLYYILTQNFDIHLLGKLLIAYLISAIISVIILLPMFPSDIKFNINKD